MARNIAATNAGVGQASVTTRVKLTIQAVKKCFIFGAVPMFVGPVAYWLSAATPQEFDIVKLAVRSTFVDESVPRKWRIRDGDGERKIISLVIDEGPPAQYIAAKDLPKALKSAWRPALEFKGILWMAFAASGFGYVGVWQLFVYRGRQQQANRRIRGASDIVEPKELSREVRAGGAAPYRLADVLLPRDAPMRGIVAIGAQGSGKSVAIHDFMQQVFARKRKCVIYDQSGEFFRAYFRPGVDMFLNPAFLGSLAWSIFVEMRNRYDANTMAQAFLPPKASAGAVGANSFFEDAARAVFAVILLRLAERGAVNTKDMARAILEMPSEEMDVLIQNSVASSAIGGDSKGQRQGVISSIAIYLDGLAAVNEGSWSISEFLDRPDDARLYLLGTDDTKAMLAPLYRLLLQTAFSEIAARQEIVHEDRYWFFLDELPQLGDIKIDEQLATKRKYGVSIFAGLQGESQLVASLGKERAESTMNGFNTVLQLAVNDPEAKERAAKRFGKAETETISQNQAVAVVEQRDGAGLVINEQEKWSIMPATFGELSTCTGYLKLAGAYPVARVDYSSWLRPRFWFMPPRIAAFREKQSNPPRDDRFKISRQTLPTGESAFDGVKRDAELARAEAEKKREEEKEQKNSAEQGTVDGVIAASMTSGSTEVSTSSPNRDLDLGLD